MDEPKKKNKTPKALRYLIGYGLGFSCWLIGAHCLQAAAEGAFVISWKRLVRHLVTVGLAVLGLGLALEWLFFYRFWILPVSVGLVLVVVLMFFLYKKAFWQKPIATILPGFKVFLCPQCYQKQAFFFTQASFQYGFFVTYLCRYCSCLVNAQGEQILYPQAISSGKISPLLSQLAIFTAMVLVGVFFAIFKVGSFF